MISTRCTLPSFHNMFQGKRFKYLTAVCDWCALGQALCHYQHSMAQHCSRPCSTTLWVLLSKQKVPAKKLCCHTIQFILTTPLLHQQLRVSNNHHSSNSIEYIKAVWWHIGHFSTYILLLNEWLIHKHKTHLKY